MINAIKTRLNLPKLLLAASGCAAIGANALALEPTVPSTASWTATYPVGYSDLDVSTMRGAKTLYLRIRFAAETLCESAATWGKKDGRTCVNKAVDEAVVRINRPLLTQYHQLRTRGDAAGLVQLAEAN